MNRSMVVASLLVALSLGAVVQGKGRSSGGGSNGGSRMNNGRGGGKDGALVGTITDVGGSSFAITFDQKKNGDSPQTTMVILCDANTVFTVDGIKDSPSAIKSGAKVAVTGNPTPDHKIHASAVDVRSAEEKPKKKKK